MIRVSVTQLDDWQKCQQFHLYRHVKGLRPAEKSEALQSGAAFAHSFEQGMMLPRSERVDTALEAANEWFNYDHRLLPGVLRAIEGVPGWLWDVERPVAEDKLEVPYLFPEDRSKLIRGWMPSCGSTNHGIDCACPQVTIVGKPDLWTVTDQGVIVVELKSTGKTGSAARKRLDDYFDWAAQALRYCVLLYDAYPHLRDLPFYRQYVLQCTSGESYESALELVTNTTMDRIRTEMLEICRQIAEVTPVRSYGILCNWCDFKELCTSFRLGFEGDEGEFEVRE